ncbi:MAG TPA: AI-2E family transporter [Actinomadura sp.]|nr:AI-2E family transporter [Actinomadura sp.]
MPDDTAREDDTPGATSPPPEDRTSGDDGAAESGHRAPSGPRTGEGPVVPAPRVAEQSVTDTSLADPVTDVEARKREAGVNERRPFGRPGEPLGRAHPFVFGFTGALGVFAAWMLIQAITNARQVLILIIVSFFIAVGLNPAVEGLQRRRLSRRWAVALVFLGVLLVFVGFGFAIVPPLTAEITAFVDHVPSYIEQLQRNGRIHELDRRYQLLGKLQTTVTNANFGTQAVNGIVGVGKVVVGGLFSTLTVLILMLYFLGSLPTIKNFCYRMAPRSRRARVALLGDEILVRIGGYVAGTVTVALIAGTLAFVFLLIAGVPFALPLALIVALTAFIPMVGATVGATIVSIVAFFNGTGTGIACVIFFVIYQQVENYVIQPRVMRRAVDVHPAVTIIAALIGGTLLGIVGALLAIPIAAAIALIVREVMVPRQDTL